MSDLAKRYQKICRQVSQASQKASRTSPPTLIAVSKLQPMDAIEELYHLGQRDFGENYVQELVEKAGELRRRGCLEIKWHFIGHLQTNKVKLLLPQTAAIHTVDSIKLAHEISKRWSALGKPGKIPVFIEVNLDAEKTKSGVAPEELPGMAAQLAEFSELEIQGLMCIPSPDQDPRLRFSELRVLEKELHPLTHGKLSMGMSSDFETAIEEGATHIRVGTSLFGARAATGKTNPEKLDSGKSNL